ncbi:MAG: T9SS type A sorting domain-containing protein [Bacteroidetes bacterium]|nr:T9SS type A sorting domain-containing protein [Bacteroidota bacterium]
MKKITFFLTTLPLFMCVAFAQQPYVTPNTAMKYSFADLVACSNGTVILEGTDYVMTNDVTISALDSLEVTENILVKIYSGKILTISGSYWKVAAPTQATFTHYATSEYYATIRVETGSYVRLNNATFTYGSGIRVISSDFEMDNCTVNNNNFSSQASGAISTTTGKVIVKNSTFKNNVRSAFNSGANTGCTFEITNCYLENNVTENTNRPQINLGPAQAGEVTKIINNTIIGNRELTQVGGISTSSLMSVPTTYFIEGNTVKDNRYGITFTGSNITGTIKGNILQDNNTQNSPNLGGSGINITASGGNTHAIITENVISGNLWGITLVGNTTNFSTGPTANLGNISVPENDPNYNIGHNIFSNNGNTGELFDLYNNNPNDIMAQNNNWGVPEQTEELIRTVIRDSYNNPNYGTVTFMPPYIIPDVCDTITNLKVLYTDDCDSTLLTWDAPTEGEFTYKVYRDGALIATVNETSCTDVTFKPWKNHIWTVVVVCENGEESEPVEKGLQYCTEVPPATNLTVTFLDNCNTAKLTWTSPSFSNLLFNIYRDNQLIKEHHDITTYSDTDFGEGSHTWSVTVFIDNLESDPVSATDACLGIDETALPTFSIVPNPAYKDITISAKIDFHKVEVINFLGQPILSQSVVGNTATLDISNLANGVYFVRMVSLKGIGVRKLVKQ